MSLDLHRRAELLMGRADALLVQGKAEEAAQLYRLAAVEEAAAFEVRVTGHWQGRRFVIDDVEPAETLPGDADRGPSPDGDENGAR